MYLKCCIKNCKQAYVTFKTVRDLNTHHSIFHKNIVFKCPKCLKQLQTPSSARFHHYEHCPPKYTCQNCNRQSIYKSKLDQHCQVHIWQRMYKCFHRGYDQQYKHPQDLMRHEATHTGKKYECDICNFTVVVKNEC